MTIVPAVELVRETGATATPFLEYLNVYEVVPFVASPRRVIDPFVPPQVVGFTNVAVMAGFDFTVTVLVAEL